MDRRGIVGRVSGWLFGRPLVPLAIASVLTALAVPIASSIRLDSGYMALLPPDAPFVRDATLVRDATGGHRQVVVTLEGADPETRRAFARDLAARLSSLDGVRRADAEIPLDFIHERAIWLSARDDLERLVAALERAISLEKARAHPLALHLDPDREQADIDAAWEEVEEIVSTRESVLPRDLESADGRTTFVIVLSDVRVMDIPAAANLLGGIRAEIDRADPVSRGIEAHTTGKYDLVIEQHEVTRTDLARASALALVLGILVVALLTRRPLAPLVVAAGLVAGLVWTLAIARTIVGDLNVITGFLVAVLAGLGIDFGIHIVVRYDEERRTRPPREAARLAAAATLRPSLAGALTTSGAFAALTLARLRAFSEFGLIASIGVILTFAASHIVIPPLLAITDRRRRLPSRSPPPSRPPSRVHIAMPLLALAAAAAALVWGALSVPSLRFHNDYAMLRHASDRTDRFEQTDAQLPLRFDPTVILVGSAGDARDVARIARETSASRGSRSMLARVLSSADVLPRTSTGHREQVEALRAVLDDPALDRALDGPHADDLQRARERARAEPWGVRDLPPALRERLVTPDGEGHVVYLWCEERITSDDVALAWEDEIREIDGRLDVAGIDHVTSTETLMPAWVHRLVVEDAPRLVVLAALVVFLIVLVHTRSVRATLTVLVPLAAALSSIVLVLVLTGTPLDMYNVVVFPCLAGIGVDDMLHLHHRWESQGRAGVRRALGTTGVAVVLTTLTTAAGFGSGLVARHPGIRSLGALALAGVAILLVSALVVLPAVLSLRERMSR